MKVIAYASYLFDEFFLEASDHVKSLTTMRQAYYEKSKLYIKKKHTKKLKMRNNKSMDGQGKLVEEKIWKGDLPILASHVEATWYRIPEPHCSSFLVF